MHFDPRTSKTMQCVWASGKNEQKIFCCRKIPMMSTYFHFRLQFDSFSKFRYIYEMYGIKSVSLSKLCLASVLLSSEGSMSSRHAPCSDFISQRLSGDEWCVYEQNLERSELINSGIVMSLVEVCCVIDFSSSYFSLKVEYCIIRHPTTFWNFVKVGKFDFCNKKHQTDTSKI